MPIYEHVCDFCNYEWEDIFKMSEAVPEVCPFCGTKGKIRRLFSLCQGRINYSRTEQRERLKEDTQKLKKEIYKNENNRANFFGEDKYHAQQISNARMKQDLKNI